MSTKFLHLSFVGLLLLTVSAWAGTSGLEGTVKDASGHPVKAADVRIEARSGTKMSKIVKTDATGRYVSDGLAAGSYKVTLLVAGTVKASILNADVHSGKRTQLNFGLTQKIASSKHHMIYVSAETGTHIGGGRWVEVDEQGRVVNGAGVNNVERANSKMLDGLRSASPRGQ
jgi:hypothetical protein